LAGAGVELAAVVDTDGRRAEAFARRYGALRHGTDPDLLFSGGLDAVHVCTPPNLHFGMVSRLIDAGIPVLCEKPLCLTGAQAYELAVKARRAHVPNAVNFNLRYHQALVRAREMVSDGAFGPVRLVHGSYLQEFHAFPAPYGWRYDEALAGKMRAVTEIGTHWFDIAQQVSGHTIQSVSAVFGRHDPVRLLGGDGMMKGGPDLSGNGVQVGKGARLGDGGTADPIVDSLGDGSDTARGLDAMVSGESSPAWRKVRVDSEDSALITMRMDGGALASVVLCETSHGRSNRLSLEVTGRDQSLWWDSEDIGKLHGARKGTGVNTQLFAFGNNGFADSFRALVAAFYEALAAGAGKPEPGKPSGATAKDGAVGDSEPVMAHTGHTLPDFMQAARIAAICDAVYESALADGAWVEVEAFKGDIEEKT
jgi:predicted dehydrogenase